MPLYTANYVFGTGSKVRLHLPYNSWIQQWQQLEIRGLLILLSLSTWLSQKDHNNRDNWNKIRNADGCSSAGECTGAWTDGHCPFLNKLILGSYLYLIQPFSWSIWQVKAGLRLPKSISNCWDRNPQKSWSRACVRHLKVINVLLRYLMFSLILHSVWGVFMSE